MPWAVTAVKGSRSRFSHARTHEDLDETEVLIYVQRAIRNPYVDRVVIHRKR